MWNNIHLLVSDPEFPSRAETVPIPDFGAKTHYLATKWKKLSWGGEGRPFLDLPLPL